MTGLVETGRPALLFVSPQFLFPMDAGGKIRSANILKHLKGGAFETRLLMPATDEERARWRDDIDALADKTALYRPAARNWFWKARRAAGFVSRIPISAFADAGAASRKAVGDAIRARPDIVIFDYVQSLAMAPPTIGSPHLFFAHNVETEILERHAMAAAGVMKLVWRREAAKMRRFETRACAAAAGVIAVSERDADSFRARFGARMALSIPTAVDTDFFRFSPPSEDAPPKVVFTGSMDWKANQDGLFWFMDDVWPKIAAARPDASFIVIGRKPPPALIEKARERRLSWRFTGFVDDIRDEARGAAFAIPLRVGGGTRMKAYEAMAMGLPVVSTSLGVEGLPVRAGEHYLAADEAHAFADQLVRLLSDHPLRARLAENARSLVEGRFSHEAAARAFERNCLAILGAAR